ncbi:kinase-like domain-containing protein [Mycena capillaripes]|nr:kinase-like domain-containing protein [Mycena capillaripes]
MSDLTTLLAWTPPRWSKRGKLEEVWAGFQPFLETHGYMLRPRYRPGWFLPVGMGPSSSETAIAADVLDATRISDGAQVILKMVQLFSADTYISCFLTKEPGAQKYTLPILDIIPAPEYNELAFMVMPRMRNCCQPDFATVAEFVDFVQQVLEGLIFLHGKNIAHRDICRRNIVIDASHMIPGGFHFMRPNTSDGQQPLRPYTGDDSDPFLFKSRTQAGLGSVRYYFIDFGLSSRFASYDARGLVTGVFGQLRDGVPELFERIPYDPFKVDICLVGEMLRTEFLLEYDGLDFIVPFVRKLCRRNPARRPDATKALALFQQHVSKLDPTEFTRPILTRYDSIKKNRQRRAILFMKGLGFRR